MRKTNLFKSSLMILLFCLGYANLWGQYSGTGTFNKITSIGELTDGYYVITNESDAFLMTSGRSGTETAGYFVSAASGASAGVITNPSTSNVWKIEANGTGGARTIYNEVIAKYAGWQSGNGASIENAPANTNRWTFSYASGKFTVLNVATTDRQLSYNPSSPRFAAYANNAQNELQLYKLATASSDPNITVSATALNPFTYVQGNGPSGAQTFTASGANLDGSAINITAPTGYEVSLTGTTGDFATSKAISYTSGAFTNQTIYIRLAAGLTAGTYNGNVSISGGGDNTAATKAVTGSVSTPPPGNDLCGSAVELFTNAAVTDGNLTNATVSSPFTGEVDVWYKITPTYDATYTFTTGGFNGSTVDIDTYLYGQSSSCPTNTTSLASAFTGNSPEIMTYALVSGTTYYVRVVGYDIAAGGTFNIQVTAPAPPADCETPLTQASSLVFGTEDATSISGSFTAAGDADRYLVVISENSSLGASPADETTYTAGNSLGNGTVVQAGSATTFTASGLNPLTTYYIFVFAYNGNCLNGPLYNTTPLTGSETTIDGPCGEEDFSNITTGQSGYATRTWNGFGGQWSATLARTDQALNGAAVTIRSGVITTPTFNNGIGSITMTTKLPFSDSAGNLTVKVNGNTVGTIAYSSSTQTLTIDNINIEGSVQITIHETNNARVAVDDVNWTCYTAPIITWTESGWSNGTGPGINDDAIVEDALTITTTLSAKNLTVAEGGSVTISEGGVLTLSGKITNNAGAESFVVASGANLIQTMAYTTNDNEGGITVQRDSREIVRLDYTMWSSPVNAQQLQAFSPTTLPGRIYTYESTSGNPNGAYVQVPSATANFENGKGYLFRSPNDWPYADTDPTGASYEGEFIGTPFNGSVSVATFANGYTSVGNPYPSNIDPELVMAGNDIDALYFWNNPQRVDNGDGTWGYTGTRYITFTGAGFSDPSYDGNSITVGQGFIVASTTSSVEFTNDMRLSDAGTFFKNEIERHRLWLELSNEESQKYNSILVGYMEGATQGVDAQIDGKMFGYTGSALYNIIAEEAYTIQGKALPFETSDVVPLGFTAAEAGKFNISLTNFDGLFAEGDVKVYLKDNQLNITHNLMESAYTFESAAGEFKNRFEIVYEEEGTMGTGDLTAGSVQVYKQGQNIVVNSKSEKIISVELYDLQGRSIHRNEKVNANIYQIRSISKGVLVVKVQTQDGKIITKKVINN